MFVIYNRLVQGGLSFKLLKTVIFSQFENQTMIDLIKAATLTNDPAIQKNAQQSLLLRREQQPEQFMLDNAQVLNNREVGTPIRHSAATLLVVSLKSKINSEYLWHSLSLPNRSAFKDLVLNTMVDPEKIIRRAAANIVAAICCIEIPRNQWPGIVQKITMNIQSNDLTVKEVSILTIGFICQGLKEFNFVLEDAQQQSILTGILMGVKESHPQILETAFKALRDGLPAMTSIMKNGQYREYLITQLVDAISTGQFVEFSIQALMEFVRSNFSLIQSQYVAAFASHIMPIIQNTKDQNTCGVAMEFWSIFAREEKSIQSNPNLNKFITGPLGDQLVECLLQNLCIADEHDDEANGINEGAAGALQAIFDGDSAQYEKKILSFTQNTIRHENWKYRQASIRAFALLLLGLPSERSQILVNSSLVELATLLNDPMPYVQISAIKSLALISEQVAEVLVQHEKFFQILQFVVRMGRADVFLKHVCVIVNSVTVPEISNKILGPHANDLIKIFLQNCLEPTRPFPLISSCFTTVINLIRCAGNVSICNEYLDYVLKNFASINSLERQKRDLFSSGFLTIAQVCLVTLKKSEGTVTMDQLSTLYNLVVEHYKKIGDVDGDGFYLVSALAWFIPNDRRLIDDFWKYIDHGLKKTDSQQIFKSTISCICDFAAVYRQQISDKLDSIFQELLKLYEKNMISRGLKIDVLMCIGELFLQCGTICFKHVKRVMDIIFISCQGVLSIGDLNYAECLQESIIETIMCIMHGLSELTQPAFRNQLPSFMPYITEFINLTTSKNKRPTLEYVQQSIMLLADISYLYSSEKPKLMKTEFIQDRVATLMEYNKDGHLNQTIKYIKQQLQLNL